MIFIDGALILIPLYYKWDTFFMLHLLHNRNNGLSHRQIDQQNCFQQSHGLPVKVSLAWTRWVSVSLKKTHYYSCLSVRPSVQLRAGSSENSHARLWNMLFAVWHQRLRLCGDVCLRSGHLRIPPERLNTRCTRLWDLKVWALAENIKCENTRRRRQRRHAHD